jgi:2-polyprenyl-3-methyl-5-hydroxy-6-metoxy-1,4-benzoquinol methylase
MTDGLVDQKNQPYQNRHRQIKEHEKAMLRLIQVAVPQRPIDVLDVGCADGLFLEAVSQQFECRTVHGLDNEAELVSIARRRTYGNSRADIFLADADRFRTGEPMTGLAQYDVIIASGILAFFEDQDGMIQGMSRHVKNGGALFVFNKIISADVDLRYTIRPSGASAWGEPRLVPSLATLTGAMRKCLRDVTVERFELPFDLKATSNVHSTYTVRTGDGSRLLLTKYNLVSELAFVYGWRHVDTG